MEGMGVVVVLRTPVGYPDPLYPPTTKCHLAFVSLWICDCSNLGKLPLLGRVSEGQPADVWVYTGLGGRGLIHHAFLGRYVLEATIRNPLSHEPSDLPVQLHPSLTVIWSF